MLPNKQKSKIRPPRKLLSNDLNVEESWSVLKTAINEIQHKNASKLSFEQLYRRAYNLVLGKHGKYLYDNVESTIRFHLSNEVRLELLEDLNNLDSKSFLIKLNGQWEDHLLSMRLISDVLMYLDRTYPKDNHLPLIYDVGLNAFRDCIIKYENPNNIIIGKETIQIILCDINKSRSGELVEKILIKSVISIIESLIELDGESYYSKYFEPELLLSSHRYYLNKINELLEFRSGSVYINNIVDLINEEENRFQIYLPDVTIPKLIEVMDKDLIISNLENILNLETDGLKNWIDNDSYEILSKIYKLVGRVDSDRTILKKTLRKIVLLNGDELKIKTKEEVDQSESSGANRKKRSSKELTTQFAIKWINNFLKLKSKYDLLIKNSFDNNIEIVKEVEGAFSTFLNENNKISEYLSLFIDDCIKKSLKDKSNTEIEKILNNSIIVFRFIKDKDIFEKYYKNHLAKRLLQQKSLSNEIELTMISKIKNEIGSSFTSKFEGMFKDIKISKDLSIDFNNNFLNMNEVRSFNNGRKLEMEPSILTTNFWPMPINKSMAEINYPLHLSYLKDQYERYYTNKYSGRNLTWAPNMGTVDFRMNYPSKSYEINMSTLSAIIILACFNNNEEDEEIDKEGKKYTFQEIQRLTRIPRLELIRHLQSISVAPKTRILKKEPMSKEIKDDDLFSVNKSFRSSSTKIKILTVSSGSKVEDDQQRNETMDIISKSRKIETEAAIVRIMKARRTLKHQELISEVIKQLINRFKPQPSFIKQRIENLIEKEYLARDEDDREIYHYLA